MQTRFFVLVAQKRCRAAGAWGEAVLRAGAFNEHPGPPEPEPEALRRREASGSRFEIHPPAQSLKQVLRCYTERPSSFSMPSPGEPGSPKALDTCFQAGLGTGRLALEAALRPKPQTLNPRSQSLTPHTPPKLHGTLNSKPQAPGAAHMAESLGEAAEAEPPVPVRILAPSGEAKKGSEERVFRV